MKYYIYTCDSDVYHSLKILPPFSAESLYNVIGKPLKTRWRPIAVEYYRQVKAGHFPRLAGHVPAFDQTAKDALGALISSHAEYLPLAPQSPDMPALFALNVPSLDCLDRNRAKASFLPDGKPIFVSKYAFREDVLKNTPIFRIKDLELSNCFVSEEFYSMVQDNSLLGLKFKAIDTI